MRRPLHGLALGLALVLAGCGGGSGDASPATAQAPSSDAETPATLTAPAQTPAPAESPATSPAPDPHAPAPGPVTTHAPQPAQGNLVFALMDVGDSTAVLDAYAARANVDGLAFRTAWGLLEPAPGSYEWKSLDAAFDAVRARGKRLTLHVGVSSIGLPRWLAGLGSATYTFRTPAGATVTDAVPWDATFLSRYTQFLAALAAHVQARGDAGLLHAVSDGAPVAEMSLPGCQDGLLGGSVAYSRASYLAAWKATIDAHAAAFAGIPLFVSAPVSVICRPDNDGHAFYTELMEHALARSGGTTVFAADLDATGSMRLRQADRSITARAGVAYQMVWSATNDPQRRLQGTLDDALCRGHASGARYYEIYKADLASAEAAVQAAIDRLRAGRPCPP